MPETKGARAGAKRVERQSRMVCGEEEEEGEGVEVKKVGRRSVACR